MIVSDPGVDGNVSWIQRQNLRFKIITRNLGLYLYTPHFFQKLSIIFIATVLITSATVRVR
jgi:hypothetical protein